MQRIRFASTALVVKQFGIISIGLVLLFVNFPHKWDKQTFKHIKENGIVNTVNCYSSCGICMLTFIFHTGTLNQGTMYEWSLKS